jgi:hypothetical protein
LHKKQQYLPQYESKIDKENSSTNELKILMVVQKTQLAHKSTRNIQNRFFNEFSQSIEKFRENPKTQDKVKRINCIQD